MSLKRAGIPLYKIPLALIVLSTCLILSSCATSSSEYNRLYSHLDKNREVFKNKSLNEVAPQFWKEANLSSVFIVYQDIPFILSTMPGDTIFFTPISKIGILPALVDKAVRQKSKDLFKKKIGGFIKSYNWKISDYFMGIFKQEIYFPKEANISFMISEDFPPVNISDNDMILFINNSFLSMLGEEQLGWGEPMAPLSGQIGVTIASGKAWQGFIQKNNGCLPITPSFKYADYVTAPTYSEFMRLKMYPDIYMVRISKHTKPYVKSKWESGEGAFLEQQMKALTEDLAKGTAKLLK
ncbi:MAG: hypothetical protein NTU54_08845 [Candidatus Omnitrophica bacterium]|nr:hypothetical protein [Candidatus Omnitrophota bacterium]